MLQRSLAVLIGSGVKPAEAAYPIDLGVQASREPRPLTVARGLMGGTRDLFMIALGVTSHRA